jgi:hypothetical protein
MTTNTRNNAYAPPTDPTYRVSPFQTSTNGNPSPLSNAFYSPDMVTADPLRGLNGQAITDPCGQPSGGGTNNIVFDDTVDAIFCFLKDIEKKRCWSKPESPISFTYEDAECLYMMLRKTDEKRKMKAFFDEFSGNQVGHIRAGILGLSTLLAGKQGFVGIWHSGSNQSLSEMLEQYVVVCRPAPAGGTRTYTTVKCQRRRCTFCKSSSVRRWTERWRDVMVCLSSVLHNGQDIWECPGW